MVFNRLVNKAVEAFPAKLQELALVTKPITLEIISSNNSSNNNSSSNSSNQSLTVAVRMDLDLVQVLTATE